MQTLVIYDNEGVVISQINGSSLREPVGVPFLWVEVPQGKYLEKIGVSTETHTPVYADRPKTETQLLQEKIDLMQTAIDDLILGGAL